MRQRFSEPTRIDENLSRLPDVQNQNHLVQQGFRFAVESMQLAQIVVQCLVSDFRAEKAKRH